ncbi:hypothetical protein GJ904_17780 [Salmonella enterica]|nr:hypothetical protein [Salmonella enterica subsp. enterica serovar Saintpaul]EEC1302923.1 hypothetical protein [Salmonella enterica]
MAAIIELTETQRASLKKLLNNLNLGFVYSGFGEAFVGMIDGTPVTMTIEQKAQLRHLINHLNMGTYHGKTGDLLVDLMGAQTGPVAAQSMTTSQVEMVADHLHNLNLGLAKLKVGDMVKATVAAYTAVPPAPLLEWATPPATPTTGTIGTKVTFKWKGGSNGAKDNYKVTVTMPDGTEHDSKEDPAKTYELATTNEAAGDWIITVESLDGQTLTQTVAMAAAASSGTPPASTGTPPASTGTPPA